MPLRRPRGLVGGRRPVARGGPRTPAVLRRRTHRGGRGHRGHDPMSHLRSELPRSTDAGRTGVAPSVFARLARWCFTHRAATITAWVIALVGITALASSLGGRDVSSFRLPGTESQAVYDTLAAHFPTQNGDSDQFVFRARSGTLRDHANAAAIARVVRRMAGQRSVRRVASPLAPGGRTAAGGRIGVADVTYRGAVDRLALQDLKRVEEAGLAARSTSLQVEHGGLGAEQIRQSSSSPSEGLGILAAAAVLLLTFGSLVAAGLPLLAAVLALGSSIGLITLASNVVDTPDFATQLATLIGLGVGIDYSLFVLTRYRAEARAGGTRVEAAVRALDTAGRTVFFAACTVIIALLGLLLLGLNFLQGVAVGAALAVLLTMIAALTLLPALLGTAGDWIDRLRLPAGRRFRSPREDGAGWGRWSVRVQRRPRLAAGVSILVLLALAAPALGLRLGSSDAGVDPHGSTTRRAHDLAAEGFGKGSTGGFLVAITPARTRDLAAVSKVRVELARTPGISLVTPPALSPDGAVATVTAFPTTGPQDVATSRTLRRIRDDIRPGLERRAGATVQLGGLVASQEDFSATVARKLPLFVGVVVLLSVLLLLGVFRSVFIPLKAALMNLLSIGAALGLVTAIFQDGLLAAPLGIETGPIEPFLPVLLFAIVFGLSMDYEVFLVSRVHEEWERSGDAHGAVGAGVATTGKVITAAASIMVVVFGAFALGDDRVIKLFGVGLAGAIFLDAVVIRCLLLPALMELAGRRAWWLPRWLDRAVPRLSLEGASPHAVLAAPLAEQDAA